MGYYTIQNNAILIADKKESLTRFYGNVYELPDDYEEGKYIIGEKEIEIEVIDPETGETHIEIITVQVLVLNPDWEQEQAEKRQAQFENTFFNIPSFGWFRKIPKGYSSAVESLNTAFNIVAVLGNLPADTLIFYVAPDFTDPEQCTEEWLIAHQTKNQQMSAQEFGVFYAEFITAWNNQEHIREVE